MGDACHVKEDDLLNAVRSGQRLSSAGRIVEEPLPEAHPFCQNPDFHRPHVAAQTNPDTAADQVSQAISRVLAGEQPDYIVNQKRGY